MEDFYKGLDIYMNTSIHEGIPMSVLEAMGHGLPVIAPKVGGFPEIIEDGINGFLIQDRNPYKFAEKVLFLSQWRKRFNMGTAARMRIKEHFSQEVMVEKYLGLYRELLQQR